MNEQAIPDSIIGTVTKNSRESVAVMLRSYKGHQFCDIRVMVASTAGGNIPTGKGVALKTDLLPELIGLLQRAHAAAVTSGWCADDGA